MRVTQRFSGCTVPTDGYWYRIVGVILEYNQCTVAVRGGYAGDVEHTIVYVTTTLDPDDWRDNPAVLPEVALCNARRYCHDTWGDVHLKERSTDEAWQERLEKINGIYN